jgi:hypothetical protein
MNIFGDEEWTYENSKQEGLPRPYAHPPLQDQFTRDGERHLAPRVPIPWQTSPDYRLNKKLGKFVLLIAEREREIYTKDICGYCAVKFEAEDDAVIWVNYDKPIAVNGVRVYSDYHPFHPECMEQTRMFCPHMKKTQDSEYKYGKYAELKEEAVAYLNANGYTQYNDYQAYEELIPPEYK